MITGAGGNFGREGCLYFASRGAKVAGLDLNPKALDETVQCVMNLKPAPTGEIIVQQCDVTNHISVQTAIDKVVAVYGKIDLCWNNAG